MSDPSPIGDAYRVLFEESPSCMWVYEPGSLRILEANRSFLAHLGYTAEQARTMTLHDLRVSSAPGGPAEADPSGTRWDAWLCRRADGSVARVESAAVEVVRGGAPACLAVARGISVLEGEMALSAAKLEQLFENAPEGIALLDNDRRVVRVNAEFTRIFGFTQAEAAGRPLQELITPPEEVASSDAVIARLADGQPVAAEGVRRHRDGRRVHVSILATPVRIDDAQVAIYSIYRDITGRKRAESERLAAEAHYRRLVETSPYGIYATDAGGRLTEANPALAEILGRLAPELLGRPFAEVFALEQASDAEREPALALGDGGAPREADYAVVRPGGETRVVQVRALAIHEDGRVTGSQGVVRDVTGERERAAHLRRVERLASIGTLLGGVAHELNNPLSAIKGFAQLMLMDPRDDHDREALEVMQREADRAAKVVANLRLVARETQEDQGERAPVDLNEVVRHVLRLRGYVLNTHNVEVEEELAPGLPRVLASRVEMEQVVLNLVVNAEQALRAWGGKRILRVRTSHAAALVTLEVTDTGPGIAPENLERVFDAFFTTKPPGEGTGLGLSLVHRIVTEHRGTLRVESTPGRGARFVAQLVPVSDGETADAGAAVLPAPPRALRVLVVDDERAVRRAVSRLLQSRGHTVVEAAEGSEALVLTAGPEPFDVILADLRMPGLSGDQLLDRLRLRNDGSERRLIFVTGDAVSPDAARILAASGAPVVEKPFDFAALAARVEHHVEMLDRDAG